MKTRLLLLLALLICAGCAAEPEGAEVVAVPAATTTIPDAAQAEITAYLEDAVTGGSVPKIVAMVANRNEVLFSGAFGKQDVAGDVDATLDSIFALASMTKPVTSVATLMLAEEGAFDLDDPVSGYLPDLADRDVLTELDAEAGVYETEPAESEITIRQLLTHTSGLAYNFGSPAMQAMIDISGEGNVMNLPLVAQPGTEWTYSPSTAVLGDLVAAVSGIPLDTFLATRITEPLGMVDTAFRVPDENRNRVVTTHRLVEGALVEGPVPETVQSPPRGDGGLYGTAPDYIRFLQMILNGGELDGVRILSEESVRRMLSNQMGDIVVQTQVSTNTALSLDFPVGAGVDTWGLGFQLAGPNAANPDLRAPGSFTWAGIFNTHFWGDPEREIAAVLLMQQLPFYGEDVMAVYEGFEERVNRSLQ
jgi:CubicO group peptidase (beta-lactamase class C family)